MKIYTFHYRGHYLGGKILVISDNEKDAVDTARLNLEDFFKDEHLKLDSVKEINNNTVIYHDNGDY